MRKRHFTFMAVLMAIVALLAACSSDSPDATAAGNTPASPATSQTGETDVATETPPSEIILVPTIDPGSRNAGTYQFRPIGEETADYFLVLKPDGTAEIDERPIGSVDPDDLAVDAVGNWAVDGDSILFQATEIRGQPGTEQDVIRIAFQDGFPVITDIKVGDHFEHLENSAFSIGAGEQHPLVTELNQRLASIDYLGFSDPGSDVYGEQTRKAVVAFQQSQGLHPDGVLDAETWLLLNSPQPPLPTPAPLSADAPPPTSNRLTATTADVDNVRGGPGTEYEVLATVPQGTAFDVTGRNTENTWVQVAYPDANGRAWVSAEFVTISGDLTSAALVDAGPTETEATPDAATTPPAVEAPPTTGVPNLDNLPTHTDDGQPIVYFTFDDGPYPPNTTPLLGLLDQYEAKVTFFNVGKMVTAYPESVRDSASRGHYIADHTWDHASLEGMTAQQFLDEVERTRQAILDAAGDLFSLDKDVRYVRPPYGATDANTRQYAAQEGMTIVLWDIDPQDWRRPGADVIANHILSHVYPGAIVLSHDGGGDRSQTIEAYRLTLPQLAEQGYVFRNIFVP